MYQKGKIITQLYTRFTYKKYYMYLSNSYIKKILKEYDPKNKNSKYNLTIQNKTMYEPVIFTILL